MSDIKIGRMTLGAVATNCYFVYREDTSDVIFFDPSDSGSYIYEQLKDRGFCIKAIYLTHAHFDHIWGCNELRELTGAKVYAYEEERVLCESAEVNVSAQAGRPYTVKVDEYLRDNESREECGMKFKVIATPGHTIGSCCYYFEEAGILISGDTLFQASVGRTDLPTGSESTLIRSISDKLMCLPDETKVYPGHGMSTSIGYERVNNPFIYSF
ncbi:MAG: MBL fold metallo-hydrolase [Lachnospiraceae bacterium]|nr:MBL fold metallo-hydrolase [Lachnospiraceae bacterium]